MRRYISLLLFIGLSWGQDVDSLDVITMKTGFVYKGRIIEASMNKIIIIPQYESISLILSRKDIETISTPLSRSGKDHDSSLVSKLLYDAGHSLENVVFYTIGGLLITEIGLYITIQSYADGKPIQNGGILMGVGSIISLFGIYEIGEAGKNLKRASYQLENDKKNH